MQTEAQRRATHSTEGEARTESTPPQTQTCPGCRAVMPIEMRFCRLCGYRLGEGVAEYAETMRFADATHASAFADRLRSNTDAEMVRPTAAPQTSTLGASEIRPIAPFKPLACNTKKTNWVVWVVLAFVIFSASSGGIFSLTNLNLSNMFRRTGAAGSRATVSRIGVANLSDAGADGGALIDVVTPPGSPLDRAGLVGGDAITMFDGAPIKDASDLREVLARTPVGKTVELVYTRDGQEQRAIITTISNAEVERLKEAFDNRPEGKGRLGIEDYDRARVPGTNIYGVQIEVQQNRPAHIAGLRDDDIIIEFGGAPIRTTRELISRIERAVPLSDVRVVVMRGNERLEIPVRMGED
jgi:hypothetical protein